MTDAAQVEQTAATDQGAGAAVDPAPAPAWQTAKNGRQFTRIPGTGGYQGVVWRKGNEAIDDAITRHRKGGSDKPPKSKRARAGKRDGAAYTPPVSRDETTRKIQQMCEDIFCMPSVPCAGAGLEWEADHFAVQGQRFAANMARSSERNPWLRRYLERGLEGEANIVAVLTSINLTTGAVGYVLPPLMKWGIIPAPSSARRMFGVPLPANEPPPPPPAVYQPPPVVAAADHVVAMWEAAEQMSQAGQGVDIGAYAAGHGNEGAEHEGVPQPPPAAPFADQV